ncbi:MAG: sigma-54-dependent Fis family transcriptional regulator [Deltaproteobacteria bacterium]|nr:sigma-54-dependent Fis family transcriptional regulator [Deltaproteobacteria bacterium]
MSSESSDATSALLLAVGGLLHQEIAIDRLLDRLVDRIRIAMDADRGTIYLVDPGTSELVSIAAHLPEIEEIRLKPGQGIAGHVVQTGEAVNVPTVTTEARFFPGVDARTGYRTESVLSVPMRDHYGNIIGVLQLLNKRSGAFPRDDERTLRRFADEVAVAIEATSLYRDLSEAPHPPARPMPISGQLNRIVGESDALQQACRLTQKVAPTDATVVIRGESGTGKELFARALHVNSARAAKPLVKVDCAALPPSLIENELFGHERGAYTGADDLALGKFDRAQGGTLFLDELGELPLAVQGKLLGVLQDREFYRVGGHTPIKTDVRIIAATNRDLEEMTADGRFRSDLYYRIKVVELHLPPLRERGRTDIERLAHHFEAVAARRLGRSAPGFSREALVRLADYSWPGNVRELENCIESALIVMDGERIEADDLPLPVLPAANKGTGPATSPDSFPTLDEIERTHIQRALERAHENQSEAARLLGISRNTLARKIKS